MVKQKQKIISKEPRELFYEEYIKLCKKYNLELAASPNFLPRDDNTFSITVNWTIKDLPPPPQVIDKQRNAIV